jgi:hypothetical protein
LANARHLICVMLLGSVTDVRLVQLANMVLLK